MISPLTRTRQFALALLLCLPLASLRAETATVHGRIEIERDTKASDSKLHKAKSSDSKDKHSLPSTVVWLTPAPGSGIELDPPKPNDSDHPKLIQKNKSFDPRILVIPAGSTVEFPNHDPFFHNVFSLFEGKRFDLGLYEAGTTRAVRFDRPGISYIFCNIHPEMSAVIITLTTPLYSIASGDGQVNIAGVPYGRYTLHIWSESMGPENEKLLTREITIGGDATSLGIIRVPDTNGQHMAHKNKYGRDYDTATPDSSIYQQQQ